MSLLFCRCINRPTTLGVAVVVVVIVIEGHEALLQLLFGCCSCERENTVERDQPTKHECEG